MSGTAQTLVIPRGVPGKGERLALKLRALPLERLTLAGSYNRDGKVPSTQIEYCIPFGANARRSGSAKLLVPSPPNVVPTSEKMAEFPLIGKTRPSAGSAPWPYPFTERTTSPMTQFVAAG